MPMRIAAWFVFLSGIGISSYFAVVVYSVDGDPAVFLKFAPFAAAAAGTLALLWVADAAPAKRRLALTLAALLSVVAGGPFALVVSYYLLYPGIGILALCPAVVFLEEAYLGPTRESLRRRALQSRRPV